MTKHIMNTLIFYGLEISVSLIYISAGSQSLNINERLGFLYLLFTICLDQGTR